MTAPTPTTPLGSLTDAELAKLEQILADDGSPNSDAIASRLAESLGVPQAGRESDLSDRDWGLKIAAENSYSEFVRQAWSVVEPDVDYIDGQHIEGIAEHLEAVIWGDPRVPNLLINIPPGCMKSLLTSVFLCPWAWIWKPSLRFFYATYEAGLSTRDSMKCRQILQSSWYQERWGSHVKLIGDQNEKTRYENNRRGWRMSTSVGGRGTGEHPDVIVFDDPIKAADAEREKERASVNDWWDGTISSRGKGRGVRRIGVMQRLHEDDLSGHILAADAAGRWVHICLPMRAEPDRMPETPLGWKDWRDPGELLWPQYLSEEKVQELEAEMGSLRAAGQLQQRPVPLGGQIFHEEWFEIVDAAPAKMQRVRYWDAAGTQGGGAYTAGVRMGLAGDGTIYVEDVKRAQVSAQGRLALQKVTAAHDAEETGNLLEVWAEQEPGSAGKDVAAIFVKQLRGYPVFVQRPTGDKVTRAMPLAAQAEAGNVKLVRGPWNRAYIDELISFPNGKYKDQVDGSSGAYNRLAAPGRPALLVDDLIASGDPEHAAEEHRPFSDAEVEELPEFLRDLIKSTRETARERDDEGHFGWGD